MPPKNAAGAKRNALKKLDPMDELTGALAELQKIQDSLDFLDIDPEDESFDWNKLSACPATK